MNDGISSSQQTKILAYWWMAVGLWAVAHFLPSAIIQELQGEWASPTHDYLGWQCFLLPLTATFSPLFFAYGPTVLVWIANLSPLLTFGFLKRRYSRFLAFAVIACAVYPLFAVGYLAWSGAIKGLGPGFFLWQAVLIFDAVLVWNACDPKPRLAVLFSVALPLVLFGLHIGVLWNSPGAKNSRAIQEYFKNAGAKRGAPPLGAATQAPSLQLFTSFDKKPSGPPPSQVELDRASFFSNAAFNFDEPQFCEKVDPRAATGSDQTYETIRSRCYRQLAAKTRNAEFCQKVDASSHLSMYTQSYCENSIKTGEQVNLGSERFFGNGSQTTIFQEAGLPDAGFNKYVESRQSELSNAGSARSNAERIHQIVTQYQSIRNDPKFIDAVMNLRSSSPPPRQGGIYLATSEERLKYFVGSDDGLPELCDRIPHGAYAHQNHPLFLRNQCFDSASKVRRDPKICDRIQTEKEGVPGIAGPNGHDWTSPNNCKDWLKQFPSGGSDAVQLAGDSGLGVEILEEMLPKLGQTLPGAATPPPVKMTSFMWYTLYTQYYEYIVKKAPASERDEFKRKLLSLNSEPDKSANTLLPGHIYRDARYGFELTFPKEVKLDRDDDDHIRFSESGNRYGPDIFSVEIQDIYDGQDSLDGIARHALKRESRDQTHNVTINDIPAVKVDHWPNGNSFEYIVVHNGKLLHFANFGGMKSTEFDPIVQTLKFTAVQASTSAISGIPPSGGSHSPGTPPSAPNVPSPIFPGR